MFDGGPVAPTCLMEGLLFPRCLMKDLFPLDGGPVVRAEATRCAGQEPPPAPPQGRAGQKQARSLPPGSTALFALLMDLTSALSAENMLWCANHARVEEGVAKSRFYLKAVVSQSGDRLMRAFK